MDITGGNDDTNTEMVKLSRDISEADVEDSTPQQQSPAAAGRGRKRGPKSKTTRILKMNKPSPNKPLRHNEAVMACKMCPNTSFRGVNEFESHLAMEHFLAELLAEYGHKKTKSCELCGENFPTVQKLARHIGADHHKVMTFYETKVEELSEIIVSKYGLDNVQCSFCKIKFRNKKLLGTHIGAVHEKFGEFLKQKSSSLDENSEVDVTL